MGTVQTGHRQNPAEGRRENSGAQGTQRHRPSKDPRTRKGTEWRGFLQGASGLLPSRIDWSNCPPVLKGARRREGEMKGEGEGGGEGKD